MSIQRKFAILLGLIGFSVLVSLAAALWSVSMFQKELADPLNATATVLGKLDDLKQSLTDADQALLTTQDAVEINSWDRRLNALANSVEGAVTQLTSEAPVQRLGVGAARTLQQRLTTAAGMIRSAAHEPSEVQATRAAISANIELIDRIINRTLDDAQRAVSHSEVIRGDLVVVLALAFANALLMCTLGLILVRRWILRPIACLRLAAERIGSGQYDHRIACGGHDEFAQLSLEINEMARLVGQMLQERVERERLAATGEMVRRLAHNLRNPLAGIRGLAEITRAELDPGSDLFSTQQRIITTVDRFEQWLAELLQSTSPLRIEPARQSVRPWMTGLVDAQRAMAQSQSVDIDLNCDLAPDTAVYDARHLEQAIVAILSNAVEVSPPGGCVRVIADHADLPHWWRIQVDDEGPGVPAEMSEKVFGANFTTKPDGHGIGLAVAQQVVRGHHGRIFVDTRLASEDAPAAARGASFVVLLPVEPLGAEPDAHPYEHPNGAISGENSHHRG